MSLSVLPEQACEAVDLGEDPKRFDFAFAFDNADFADRLVTLCMTSEEDGRSEESIGDACESDLASSPSAPDQAGSMPSTKRGSRNPPSLLSTSATSSPRAAPSVSLQLSSVILAAKSSFFRSLFTCGLKEACGANPVVLNVCPDGTACLSPSCANLLRGILRECREGWGGVVEVEPVVDLLRFIYTGDMQEGLQDPEDLIKMFLVADKFGVGACMKICLQNLASLPMTVATACLYLSLPDSMHSHRGVAHLLEASRLYLVSHFRDLERVYKGEEFLDLPLVGLQTLLASDELNVRDEVTAFSAMLEWVRHHEEDLESRRTAAAALAEYVRFPLMTGDDLEEVVLKTEEMASEGCAQLVKEAAWFRSYSLVRRLRLMNETGPVHRRFWQRKWNRNSVGYVYFDIHLERFQALAVTSTVESATFGIGGKRFYLSARHGRRDDQSETLDIHLHLDNSTVVQPEIQVSFIFYAKRWPEGQFDYLRDRVTKGFGRNASNWGYSNILGRPWAEVVQNDSKYFNNGVMSVFAEVQILEQEGGRLGACSGS